MMAVSAVASIAALVASTAAQFGVPPALGQAVANQESGFNQSARGAAGEIGVMQLMPSTAASLGVDPTNLQSNIAGGMMYLAQLYQQFGSWEAAVAAYNDGPGNVANDISSGGANWFSLLPSSTQSYVASVLGAAGMSYDSVAQTPAPAGDATAAIDTSGDSTALLDASMIPSVDPTTLFLLTAAGIGAFFLARMVSD